MTMSARERCSLEVLEAHRLAAHAVGELHRGVERAVGHQDLLDAVRLEVRRRELAGLAGADDEHGVVAQLAEHLQGELDGGRADAHGPLADGGLGAHALAHFERVPEQPVEDHGRAAAVAGHLVGGLELGDDLRLADDHAVEARGDAEEMRDGAVAGVAVERRLQLARLDAGVPRQVLQRRLARRERVAPVQVQLGAVAGAERDDLAGHALVQELLAQAQRGLLVQGEALAQLQRGGLVGDAGDDDVHALSPRRCGSR